MQQATTDMVIFPIPARLAYCSTLKPLAPGDAIVTGTSSGAGARRNPPVFMQLGDTVEGDIDRIDRLRNSVARD